MVSATRARVALCIATCRRPALLGELIDALGRLSFVNARPEISLVVVDNDPAGSGRDVIAARRLSLPFPVSYCVEAARGYSQARNRTLQEAGSEIDFIAFIDDDELPAENWLEDLLSTQAKFGAGLVAGPVIPLLPTDTPEWVVKGRFFERPHRQTGAELETAGAGNLLISREVLSSVGSFDDRFGGSGGEDTDFTMRARRAGYTIVWCDEAVVFETVEPNRLSVRWLCKRSFLGGRNFYRVELEQSPTLANRLRILAKAIGRGVEGIMSIAVSPVIGFHRTVSGLRSVTRAAGTVAAVMQSRVRP